MNNFCQYIPKNYKTPFGLKRLCMTSHEGKGITYVLERVVFQNENVRSDSYPRDDRISEND